MCDYITSTEDNTPQVRGGDIAEEQFMRIVSQFIGASSESSREIVIVRGTCV